jgi:hypothetical protein
MTKTAPVLPGVWAWLRGEEAEIAKVRVSSVGIFQNIYSSFDWIVALGATEPEMTGVAGSYELRVDKK